MHQVRINDINVIKKYRDILGRDQNFIGILIKDVTKADLKESLDNFYENNGNKVWIVGKNEERMRKAVEFIEKYDERQSTN